ncbi:very long chain fatty acid elongase 6-like isoform X1 [Centruroides vittatus]|uniref:very long chain fatty acid elongase 6-like isoform X1 n=2 Tax=Centruroides vittatus TaxID=120091 RepID=UPI003510A07F
MRQFRDNRTNDSPLREISNNFTVEMEAIVNNSSSTLSTIPHYSIVFNFENEFDQQVKKEWMKNYWQLSLYSVSVYMIFIFAGRAYMKSRPPFDLRRILTVWNIVLAVFSIMGTLRTMPEFLHVIREFGLTFSVCNPTFMQHTKVSGFWAWMFTLSKISELGDTVFIVLRKQKLIFLHWYHHITVLLFVWYTYTEYLGPARWFMVMNYFVHSFMYSYYALRALRISVPKFVAQAITTVQIIQMFAGCFVCFWAYRTKLRGEFCQISMRSSHLAILMYVSYLVLFSRFFYNSYLKPKQDRMKKLE